MAIDFSDFNETEYFEEYNPHPYQGGYDIALTYGNPLTPSSAICYPMSDASSHPPLPQKVPLPSVPVEPAALPAADYGSSYGFGADWWWNPSGRYDAEEMRFWGPLRRAADFIFGHSQGFGERRIGVDSYGIPIYAYRRHGSDSVSVEIQPARTEKLEYHGDSERWSWAYDKWEDGSYGSGGSTHAYLKNHPEELFDAEVDPVESVFSWKDSHHGLYEEEVYPERKWVPSSYAERRNEVDLYGNLEMAYDKHYYGGAQNVQLEAVESSVEKLSYHEASDEFSYTDANWEPPYSIHGDDRNEFTDAYHDYENRDYQQPSDVELEPYNPTWVQYPGYYGISEEDDTGSQPFQVSEYSEVYNESSSPRSARQTSSFGEWGNEDKFNSPEYEYQTQHDDHSFELEPFKSTWMLNPNYYGSYADISASYNQDDGSYGSVW